MQQTKVEWKTCDACGFEYPNVAGIQCPKCSPMSTPSELRLPERRDILDVLNRIGVNVHRYKDAKLETFDTEHDPHVMEATDEWVKEFAASVGDQYPTRSWLYFYGDGSESGTDGPELGALGNGKTFMAIAIIRQLLETELLHDTAVRFTTAESLLLQMEATFRSTSTDSEQELLHRLAVYELLVIDDFGVRAPSLHAMRILDELTKRREGKATVWTSNLSLKVIAEQHANLGRIVSRIAGECGDGAKYVVKFSGPDRRILRSKGEKR